ncbi:hypothetical protein RYX45_14210 [Alkalihalophilus pseudofirmus]|uniref:Uncharacterized protein n=1 Tax=Alkalihalophilus pseudofirmus TaxID=79885 RepID=A0AAJ2NPR4_ALKPS|nr:hypothetical protein [Alkalihalophilus pseudofirmus]MDV2886340.1 hypothetical protein [Alkalihalophilus pseudofirmus]
MEKIVLLNVFVWLPVSIGLMIAGIEPVWFYLFIASGVLINILALVQLSPKSKKRRGFFKKRS